MSNYPDYQQKQQKVNYPNHHYAQNTPQQQMTHPIQPQPFMYQQPNMMFPPPPQEMYGGMYHQMDYQQQMLGQGQQQAGSQTAQQYQMKGVTGSTGYSGGMLQMPTPVQNGMQMHQQPIPFSTASPQGVYVATTPPAMHGLNQQYMMHPQMNYQAMSQTPQASSQQQLYQQQQQQQQQLQQLQIDENQPNQQELDQIVQYIVNLKDPEKKEEALQELSKKRESFGNLAPLLWHSNGTIALLIEDIVAVYSQLAPNVLTQTVSTQVCSVLGLLQCLALHQETKQHFIKAHIPLFLYPFLNTSAKQKPFENLRVTSLGVIGALVKGDDTEAITFLMQTEIIPLCLRIMKRGQELSRTVATFVVQKILVDESGLNYICQTAERFFAVSTVLQSMIEDLQSNQKDDQRLLRHIIRCYQRLSENNRANEALKKILPQGLKDPQWSLIKDESVRKLHQQLMENLSIGSPSEDVQSSTNSPQQQYLLQQPQGNGQPRG